MRRFIISCLIIIVAVLSARAADEHFDYTPSLYSHQTKYYVHLEDGDGNMISPTNAMQGLTQYYYIGAFIDGECRGEAMLESNPAPNNPGAGNGVFELPVWGDLADNDKPITFRLYYKAVYGVSGMVDHELVISHHFSIPYDAYTSSQGSSSSSTAIPCYPVEDVMLPAAIELNVGERIDLLPYLETTPQFGSYSAIEWNTDDSGGCYSLDGNTLTAISPTSGNGALLAVTVTIPGNNKGEFVTLGAYTIIHIVNGKNTATSLEWMDEYANGYVTCVGNKMLWDILNYGYIVQPFDAVVDIRWSSDDESVVGYDDDGCLIPLRPGFCMITGVDMESGLKLEMSVKVEQQLELKFNADEAIFPAHSDITDRVMDMLSGNFDEAWNPSFHWEIYAVTQDQSQGVDYTASKWAKIEGDRIYTLEPTGQNDWVVLEAIPDDDYYYSAQLRLIISEPQVEGFMPVSETLQIIIPANSYEYDITDAVYANLVSIPDGFDLKNYMHTFEAEGSGSFECQKTSITDNGIPIYKLTVSGPFEGNLIVHVFFQNIYGDEMEIITSFHLIVTEDKVKPTGAYWKDEYKDGITVRVGDSRAIDTPLYDGYVVTPEGATATFTWKSSDESIVAPDPGAMMGFVGIKAGVAYLIGTSEDLPDVTLTLKVTVIQPVTGIRNDEPSLTVVKKVGDEFRLHYTVLPEDAYNTDCDVDFPDDGILVVGYHPGGYYLFQARKPGTTYVTITTFDGNFQLKYEVIITDGSAASITGIRFAETELTIMREDVVGLPELITEPEGSKVDPSLLQLEVTPKIANGTIKGIHLWRDEYGEWRMVGLTPFDSYTLRGTYPLAGGRIQLLSINVTVADRYRLHEGWNWVGFPFGSGARSIYDRIYGLVEIRDQVSAMHHDPELGCFGSLYENTLQTGQGYRLYTTEPGQFLTFPKATQSPYWFGNRVLTNIEPGWNWLASPLPRPYTLEQLFKEAYLPDGTVIKSFDAVATYDEKEQQWIGSLKDIGPGEAFMIYLPSTANDATEDTDEDLSLTLRWPLLTELGEQESYIESIVHPALTSPSVAFDGSPAEECSMSNVQCSMFNLQCSMSNMAIIAIPDTSLTTIDPSRYSICAFVGDQCRGQGVLEAGRWHIVVHASSGEQVSLRLYDHATDTYLPLAVDGQQQTPFAEQYGTLRHPSRISTSGAFGGSPAEGPGIEDAIVSVYDAGGHLFYRGRLEASNLQSSIFNLQSLNVSSWARGVYIIYIEGSQGKHIIKFVK